MPRAGMLPAEGLIVHALVAFLLTSIALPVAPAACIRAFSPTKYIQDCLDDRCPRGTASSCFPRCPRCRMPNSSNPGTCVSGRKSYPCRRTSTFNGRFAALTAAPSPGATPPLPVGREAPRSPEEPAVLLVDPSADEEIISDSVVDFTGGGTALPAELFECSNEQGLPIELFQHFELTGRMCGLFLETPRLDADFLNLVSSCKVNQGTWILYSGPDFQGEVAIRPPGTYEFPWLMEISNDGLSSMRPYPPDEFPESILLFEDPGYRGAMIYLTEATPDFLSHKFNDKASSAIVIRGTWRLHTSDNYGGVAFDLIPGRYESLQEDNDVSSADVRVL